MEGNREDKRERLGRRLRREGERVRRRKGLREKMKYIERKTK